MKFRFVFIGFFVVMMTQIALAAPFVGKGQATTGTTLSEVNKARALARQRARKAALEQAILTISPRSSHKRLLQQYEQWTTAYRILGETTDGATITSEVEVEIDETRLAKQFQVSSPTKPSQATSAQQEIIADDCPREVVQLISQSGLTKYTSRIDVRCQIQGYIDYTAMQAGKVTLEIKLSDSFANSNVSLAAMGFASDASSSLKIAAKRASMSLIQQVKSQEQGTFLEVEPAGPARCMRRLATTIQRSAAGVNDVTLVEILSDGTVLYQISGTMETDRFVDQLATLQVPGCVTSMGPNPTSGRLRIQIYEQEKPLMIGPTLPSETE